MKSVLLICSILYFSPAATAQAKFSVGQQVEVNYNGHWYKSTILAVNGDKYKVHYEGYPASDDAWMHFSYIRAYGKNAVAAPVNTCSFGPPAGNFSNNASASNALFKKELYDWYAMGITGAGSAPKKIGISFIDFQNKAAYRNIVTNEPGRGAVRRHTGAPANTTIYPVRVSIIVCKQYGNGEISRDEVNADFSFFKNKEGEWSCSKD